MKLAQLHNTFDRTKNLNSSLKAHNSTDKSDKKSERKQNIISSFVANEKKEASIMQEKSKVHSSQQNYSKDSIIKICSTKYKDFDDLMKKYKSNIEEIKKAKDSFLANYIRNQNNYQIVLEKLKGTHFGIEEKRTDTSMFINDQKKFISWNITYNPFVFLSLVVENVSFENLQVLFCYI